jgi:transcriptional regulator with XRE-family HTH domain
MTGLVSGEKLMSTAGDWVKERRDELGVSREKLAEIVWCHPSYIGRIERGEASMSRMTTPAGIRSLHRTVDALGINDDDRAAGFELLGIQDNSANPRFSSIAEWRRQVLHSED